MSTEPALRALPLVSGIDGPRGMAVWRPPPPRESDAVGEDGARRVVAEAAVVGAELERVRGGARLPRGVGSLNTGHALAAAGEPAWVHGWTVWWRGGARNAPPLVVAVLSAARVFGVPDFLIHWERRSVVLGALSALTPWLKAYEAQPG
jgi:hypothetical protein